MSTAEQIMMSFAFLMCVGLNVSSWSAVTQAAVWAWASVCMGIINQTGSSPLLHF